MQKILATLKLRKGSCWLAILLVLVVIIAYLQTDRRNLQIDNKKLQETVEKQQTEKKQLQADKENSQKDKGILQAYSEELELANGRAQKTIKKLRTSNKKYKKSLKAIGKSIDLIEVKKTSKKVVIPVGNWLSVYFYDSEREARENVNLVYSLQKVNSEVELIFENPFIGYGQHVVINPSGKEEPIKDIPYTYGGGLAQMQINLKERGTYLVHLKERGINDRYFALLW